MSHRKAYSQGSIPFSWEDRPGVCKTPNNNEYPLNIGASLHVQAMDQKSPNYNSTSHLDMNKKIPFPPCPLSKPLLPPLITSSTSGKGFKWQQDPFLVAYKKCTKTKSSCGEKNDKMSSNKQKYDDYGSNFSSSSARRIRRGKYYMFSCRNSASSDVRDDSHLKLSQLPRLPTHRSRSLTLQHEHQPPGFNYGSSWL